MKIEDHEKACQQLLGQSFPQVHIWLDEYFAQGGPSHRCRRHHIEGVEQVRSKWGNDAAKAAKIHILQDCWGLPCRADYKHSNVDQFGSDPASAKQKAEMMLHAILAQHLM